MLISEEIPNVAPVSDSSASSSQDENSSMAYGPASPTTDIQIPTVVVNTCKNLDVSFDSLSLRPSTRGKSVRFGDLEMRRYPVILGDHPDCSMGPPITIGWKYCNAKTIEIDRYEAQRSPRRRKEDLRLDWIKRKKVLRRISDVSDEEMREAASEAQHVKRQREQTVKRIPMQFLEAASESLIRKLTKKRKSSKKLEKKGSFLSSP